MHDDSLANIVRWRQHRETGKIANRSNAAARRKTAINCSSTFMLMELPIVIFSPAHPRGKSKMAIRRR
jgi:hypothetical protein